MFGMWGKREADNRTYRPRRKTRLLAPALAGIALAAGMMAQTAVASPLDGLASLLGLGDAAPAAAADHVVGDTVSPSGTTIDLFDYWLTTEDGSEKPGNITSAGINAGNQLWFSNGIPEGGNGDYGKTINHYGGGGKGPHFGIVASELGHDGYPVLAKGKKYSLAEGGRFTEARSLAYLFNPLVSNTYKNSYPNVSGLLQLDADGYYFYDSTQNFASYNKDTNRFVLYDGAAVDGSGFADSTKGMFFPFNTAEQVFTQESLNGSGPLQSTVGPNDLNHYFGLSMTSYFMQPANGQSNGKDMVFEFSGDDDVWVFIDGKLVGDVGGIHDRVGLSINFATGDIKVYNTSTAGTKGQIYEQTSLQEIFGGENLENGTFKTGSYHTLKFYYLERGSGPSNMSLKYNLVDIPASTMTKVDQLGQGVQGAEFELYQTDDDYGNEKLIGSGVTDATGGFTFTDANTVPINFMNLNASGISHYVLKETKTPEGYRKSPDARLKYVTNADKSIGFLLSDNYWESGVYARPEQVVTIAGDTVKEYGRDNEIKVGDGNVFAVILKRDRSEEDMDKCWHAVSGNSVDGWTVSSEAITSTSQLTDAQKVVFTKNEDGKYVADLKELPGDPEQYYFMVSEEAQQAGNFDYTVAFYAYDGKDNIKRLDTSTQYFQRQSAANLHVTDIRNMLHVQKVDDAGTPVNGVTFNLYRSSQMIETGGKLAPRAGEDPAFTGKTQDNRNNNDATIKMDGMLSLGPLSPGTYYLVEDADKAPEGYIPNEAVVRVIVDDEGVHADAGVEGDGVVTLGGIGSLVDSMSQFGVKDDIDMTLYRVIATKATSTASDADGDGAYTLGGWTPGTDTVTMENRPDSAYLEYVPVDPGATDPGFTVDTGYVRATVSQDTPDADDLGMANWTDLSQVANKNLSALFTGTNIVRITNERTASIAVSKEVAVPEGFELSEGAKARDFTLTFTFENLGNLPTDTAFDAATFALDENGVEQQVGKDYTIASGGTHTLKHGETIKVYGLPNGASYSVTETRDDLYPQTEPADKGAIEGMVVAGETQTGTFVNTYAAKPATLVAESIKYAKVLENWDAIPGAAFDIWLSTSDPAAPLPAGEQTGEDGARYVSKTATKDSPSSSFDTITYTKPGEYLYSLYEKTPAPNKQELGVDYSMAVYRAAVTVTDDGTGALSASVSMVQTVDDQGVDINPHKPVDSLTATFTNRYDLTSSIEGLRANKVLVDASGSGRVLQPGAFSFKATALNRAPALSDSETENVADGLITFGTVKFTEEHVGHTYTYKLEEVVPEPAEPGMAYHSTPFYGHIAVTKVELDGNPAVKTTVTYSTDEAGQEPITTETPTFTNTYDPNDVTLTGDTRIKGQKTLKGRDALAGEAFTFKLTAFDDFTKQALDDGTLVFGADAAATELVAQVIGAKNGEPCAFAFDSDMTFTKVGTYRFAIKEMVPERPAANMTYDPATAEAVVTITDAGGKLEAAVSYINPQAPSIVDRAVFTNVYHAEGGLAEGIEVSKVLTGRAMKAGEFSATVVGIDNEGGKTTADDANAKLPKVDTEISFPKASAGKPVSKKILGDILFTQEDAGKTFSYIVAERVPAEGVDTAGVTYDRSRYRVDLAVRDDAGTGKLAVTATVTRVVDRDGGVVADPVTVGAAAFENRYAPAQTTIEDTVATLPLSKRLSGRDWLAEDAFEFALSAKSLNGKTDADSLAKIPMPANATAVVTRDSSSHYDSATGTVPDSAIKDFGFKDITYTQVGTYVYEVREVVPDDATNPDVPGRTYGQASAEERAKAGWSKDGVTYDSATVATVTCEVKDNLTGQLYVEAECDPAAAPTFTNTYAAATTADTSVGIEATKTFVNHRLDANTFDFGVAPYRSDGTLGDEVLAGTNEPAAADQPARVTFQGELSYDTEGLAKAVEAGYANASVDGLGRATWTLKYLAYEKEFDAGEHPGVTQTASSFNFTVTVTDAGDGTLSASANFPAGGLAFVNTYNTEGDNSVTYAPTGAKVLKLASEGLAAPDIDGRYRFTLTGEDGAPMPDVGGSVTVNDRSSVNFGAIAFTLDMLDGVDPADDGSRSKAFAYTVFEEGFVPGVTNDAEDGKSFKLTLADDGKGHLTVTPEGDPRLPLFTFVNTYTAQVPASDPVTTNGLFAKVLTGRDWMRGDAFTFAIEPVVDGTPMPDVTKVVLRRESAKAGEPQTFGFGKIEFTYDDMKGSVPSADGTGTEKTFEYAVREIMPADAFKIPGITYSGNVAHLAITLKDDGAGNLTVTRSLTDDEGTVAFDDKGNLVAPATFTNAYIPGAVEMDPAAAGFTFTKVLEGKAWDGDAFAFTLEGAHGAPMPASDVDSGVTDNGDGTLTKTVSAATHEVDGFDAADFSFGPIRFERAGVYAYTVREVAPEGDAANPGIAYDGHVAKVEVTVTDDGSGKLAATVVVEGGTFTNVYATGTVDFDAAAGLQIVKNMTGRAIAKDAFSFTVKGKDAGSAAKLNGGRELIVGTAGAPLAGNTATETLPVATKLSFAQEDAGKTYRYTVFETDGGKVVDGVTYDGAKHELAFAVADAGSGVLKVAVSLDGEQVTTCTAPATGARAADPVTVTFNNSYDAGSVDVGGDGSAAIRARKVLTGRPLAADEFSFNVVNTLDENAELVTSGTNDAQGDIAFEPISYTVEKLNNDVAAGLAVRAADGVYTYTYAVSEDTSSLPAGVTPVAASLTVKVLVADSGTGSLDARVVYPEGSDGALEFRNAYGAGAGGASEVAVGGTKVLKVEGGAVAPDIAGKYTFTLTGSEGAPMPEGAKDGVKMATNEASGVVDFGAISYTMDGVFGSGAGERTKTFAYTVAESGEVPGVVNDPVSSRSFTVTVTDNGDGTLSAVSSEKPGAQFAFTNTYAVEPHASSPTSAGLSVTKALTGRELRAGEFAFQLVDAAGKVVSTGVNDAEGKVKLPAVTFTEPGDFAYTLREVPGDAAGVTYDARSYGLRAHVADNGDGTLGVTWAYGADGTGEFKAEFENAYTVAPRTIAFNAAKVLTGRELAEGEFSFQLYDGAGNLLQTVKNGALVEGGYAPVVFDAVTIDRAGAYDFRIVEVAGDAEGIAYDKTEFTYHVVASDLDDRGNHTGKLELEITEGETGAPVFRNTFSGTDEPGGGGDPGNPGDPDDPNTPDGGDSGQAGDGATTPDSGLGGGSLVATGDDSLLAIVGVGAAGLVAVVAGIVVAKRRNRR